MRRQRARRRRVQPRLIGRSSLDGVGHGVIQCQDDAFSAVLAPRPLILAPHNRERLHDVVHVVALNPVQVKVRGVQLAAQQETPLLIPPKRWPRVATLARELAQVPRRIRQLERTRTYPLTQYNANIPCT